MRFSLVVLAVLATFMTGCISSVVKEAVKPYEKELEKYRSTPKITNSLIISRTYWPGLEFRPVSKRISITADGFLRYSTMESWKQKTFETKKEIQLSNNQLLDLIKIFYENFIDLREKYHLPTTDSPSYEYYFKDDFTEKKVTVTGGHPFPEELNIINKVLNELLDKIADGQ